MGSRRARARRTWPQRLIIGFNVIVVVAAFGAAATLGYVNDKLSDVKRLALSGALTEADAAPGSSQNFLIVGTDSDSGLDDDDPARAGRGDVTGTRGDTIMILHLDPATHTAELLSLQRDLWVTIAGQGTKQRINTALALGGDGTAGPETLIQTIEDNFDIPIHHYLEVDFAGFQSLVEAIDGVPIYFNTGVRDYDPSDGRAHTAINIPGPGCYTLDPAHALAYARSRHMQYQSIPGDEYSWVDDNGNDFGRIQRQQDFVRRVLKRVIAKGVRDPLVLRELIDTGVASVQMDEKLSVGDLMALGRTFRDFDPDELVTTQMPVVGLMINGASVLEPKMPEAEAVLAPFQMGGTRADPALRAITVRVRNGTGNANEATNVARALEKVGFQVATPSDELGVTDERSIIRYRTGSEKEAQTLARHLASDVDFELVENTGVIGTDELMLITGTSFEGVLAEARPAAEVPAPEPPATDAPPFDVPDATTTTTTSTVPGSTTTTTIPGFLPGPTPAGEKCG